MNSNDPLPAVIETQWKSKSKEYHTWIKMRARCENPNTPRFERWGGRGISVCERWKHFENFLTDMGRQPDGTSLDRIDNDGNYGPTNCRWATRIEQANNRISNRRVEFKGEVKTVAEWARLLKFKPLTLIMRLRRGWSPYKALTGPLQKNQFPNKTL
jgi:hypothetical protein